MIVWMVASTCVQQGDNSLEVELVFRRPPLFRPVCMHNAQPDEIDWIKKDEDRSQSRIFS